ncbi:MAG TPA: PKD domain-containing protein, partial [Chitinophagaceae bacterium]|nr:PKD domain-containing protein [Chitinophagaceae bacterium]
AEENISHYLLVIIDELETLVELLSEDNIEEFDVAGFSRHAATLDETYTLLNGLLTGYHSKGYQVAKIKINTGATYTASVDQIGTAMAIISDDDAYNIITLIKNSSSSGSETTISLTSFIASLQASRNNYTAQERTIRNYLNSIKDAMVLVDRNNLLEPVEGTYTSEYSPILTFLKSGKCKCDIDKLKFLLERYQEQRDQLTDLNNFSIYTQHHPGIEHKAGVTKGGTFIIVYKGANDPRADIATGIVVADFYLPYVCSSNCTPIEVTVQEAPPPVNIRPIAKPGGNLYIETPTTTSVTLDGSYSTDPDGTIMVYAWTKISAPAAGGGDLTNENTPVATASNFFVGVYTYKLTVTDNNNATNEDILTITVSEKFNNPPIAVATTDKSTLNFPAEFSVQLRGENSTDPDSGTVLTYSWVLDPLPSPDNSGVGGMPSSNKNPAVTFTKTGLFGFKLTVTDNKGKSASDKVFVLVKDTPAAPNKIPVAEAKVTPNTIPFSVGVTLIAKLDGTGSFDPDGTPITYKWALQAGITDAEAKIINPDKETTDVIFKKAGVYLITLTVFDSAGASANDYVLVTVTDENKEKTGSCASLADIIVQFNGLSGIGTAAAFKSFRDKYTAYSTVAKFYQELEASNVASLSIQEQIDFFNSKGTGSLLTAGINELQNLILEQTAQRPFALTMFNIHAQLAYYLECIQTLDIDKAKLGETFEALLRVVKLINQVVATFSSTEKSIYRTLRILTVSESERVNSKGEQNSKKIYLKALTAIIEQIPATL